MTLEVHRRRRRVQDLCFRHDLMLKAEKKKEKKGEYYCLESVRLLNFYFEGPKKQGFWPRLNIIQGNGCILSMRRPQKLLSKSIFYIQSQ